MPRDIYHDFVTAGELTNCRNSAVAARLFNDRTTALLRRSGAMNVRSGKISAIEDARTMTRQLWVSFDSRAWTGRGH
jgi:hypothetical protein